VPADNAARDWRENGKRQKQWQDGDAGDEGGVVLNALQIEREEEEQSQSAEASVPGSNSAAPIPCSTRVPINTATCGANAHPSDAIPKTARPTSTICLYPRRSPIVPLASSSDASASA
jgi:hypothetical protein